MKKLMLVLLLALLLLSTAAAEELVFPAKATELAFLTDVLSAPPYSLDAGQIAAQYGWVDFIQGISFPCRVGISENGRQLQVTLERDFAYRQPTLTVRAERLFECEFSYSAKAGCYVASDVALDADAQGLTPFEFVCAHWDEATFEYSAESADKEITRSCTITGSPASGEVASLQIEEQQKNGSGFTCSWDAAGEDDDATLAYSLLVPFKLGSEKYTASVTADYGGDDASLVISDGCAFFINFRSSSFRIQLYTDAQGQPVYTQSTASGAVYNRDGALSLLAKWNDETKEWKTIGTPTKADLPSVDDVLAMLSIRIE